MKLTRFDTFQCSLSRSLAAMGEWWTPLILRDVHLGLNRFDELAVDLGISRNLLTTRLGDLVERGLLDKVQYLDRPVRYRYELTSAGKALVPILLALTAWGDEWQPLPAGPPVRLRHDGHECRPEIVCAECARPLTADNVDVRVGPGGRAGPGTQLVGQHLMTDRAG